MTAPFHQEVRPWPIQKQYLQDHFLIELSLPNQEIKYLFLSLFLRFVDRTLESIELCWEIHTIAPVVSSNSYIMIKIRSSQLGSLSDSVVKAFDFLFFNITTYIIYQCIIEVNIVMLNSLITVARTYLDSNEQK